MLTLPQPLDSIRATFVTCSPSLGSRGVGEQSKENCSDDFHGWIDDIVIVWLELFCGLELWNIYCCGARASILCTHRRRRANRELGIEPWQRHRDRDRRRGRDRGTSSVVNWSSCTSLIESSKFSCWFTVVLRSKMEVGHEWALLRPRRTWACAPCRSSFP